MIQLILMLLGLAFGNNNVNTTCDNSGTVTTQDTGSGTGTGIDPGTGGDGGTSGNTGQKPPIFPPSTNP